MLIPFLAMAAGPLLLAQEDLPPAPVAPVAPAMPAAPPVRAVRAVPPGQPALASFGYGQPTPEPEATRFDLDFPGGDPETFVAAISKALGKEVNAIVPDEHKEVRLPAMKVRQVTVVQVFEALEIASSRLVERRTSTGYFGGPGMPQPVNIQNYNERSGFRTKGPPNENAIWVFYHEGAPKSPPEPPGKPYVALRFYQLAPYLETGTKVEDITTAIQTGWKMLDDAEQPKTPFHNDGEPPKLTFHKDTKLLIVAGPEQKLNVVSEVLQQLPTAGSGIPSRPPSPIPLRPPAVPQRQ
jgi:hypothetical protein